MLLPFRGRIDKIRKGDGNEKTEQRTKTRNTGRIQCEDGGRNCAKGTDLQLAR